MSEFGDEDFDGEAPRSPFPPESQLAISGLLHLGYIEKRVSYAGHEFVMRTLKSGEEITIALIVKEWSDSAGFAKAYATAAVAASLETLDGVPLYGPLSDNMRAPIEQKFQTVRQWYWPVIEHLYNEYTELLKEQIEAFEAFEVKS